jgi:hypothetical protein
MAKFGLSIEGYSDDSTEVKVKPNQTDIAEYKAIEKTIDKYLDDRLYEAQSSNVPLPSKLSQYLKTKQADLDAIETYLIDNPIAEWGTDDSRLEKNSPDPKKSQGVNLFNLSEVEDLIMLDIINLENLPNIDISRRLGAIEKIQLSIQARPSTIGQRISRLEERKIAILARQIDKIPTGWGDNLFATKRREQIRSAIEDRT